MTTMRVSLGQYAQLQDISSDGRHILYGSFALTDPGASSPEGPSSYDFDIASGARQPILVNPIAPSTDSSLTSLSADEDASIVAFGERFGGLVPDDTNGTYDVFVLDRATGGMMRERGGGRRRA